MTSASNLAVVSHETTGVLVVVKDSSSALVIHGESDTRVAPAGSQSAADIITTDSDVIRILTYNVWFNEECQVAARMAAVGDVILRHQPHVVMFQEVTPVIYSLLSSSLWWRELGFVCSVEEAEATRPYFTMLITRLPCENFRRTPFAETSMDRELVTAVVDTAAAQPRAHANTTAAKPRALTGYVAGEPRARTVAAAAEPRLTVATAHLESPMSFQRPYIGPRNTQAREALEILSSERNVVFGGDMNWNERRDGRVPLPPHWFDAWNVLHPIEKYLKPGYTYDGRTNRMIGGALQGRLDRFWCRLEDFDVETVEMVGTEPIPGLRCDREFPSGDKIRRVSLPVFPSDHYGVLLQLRRKRLRGPGDDVLRICDRVLEIERP